MNLNLVDNDRNYFGLLFSSKIYSEKYASTVIVNRLLPEFEYAFGTGEAFLDQATKHVAIFAYTVNVYVNDSTNEFEPCWNIKHADKILQSGLINDDMALGYITNNHFIEIMDQIIEKSLQANSNDRKKLSRFSAIMQATNYASIKSALKYSSDDSFTDDMILRLGKIVNQNNITIDNSEDCEYILKAIHELPDIYSSQLLGANIRT